MYTNECIKKFLNSNLILNDITKTNDKNDIEYIFINNTELKTDANTEINLEIFVSEKAADIILKKLYDNLFNNIEMPFVPGEDLNLDLSINIQTWIEEQTAIWIDDKIIDWTWRVVKWDHPLNKFCSEHSIRPLLNTYLLNENNLVYIKEGNSLEKLKEQFSKDLSKLKEYFWEAKIKEFIRKANANEAIWQYVLYDRNVYEIIWLAKILDKSDSVSIEEIASLYKLIFECSYRGYKWDPYPYDLDNRLRKLILTLPKYFNK